MLFKQVQVDRERTAGVIIVISLFVILISAIGVRLLDVKVTNIEFIDRGLYSIITDDGPVNIRKDDVLRIERTYTKVALTGTPVELHKIYTTKGFIYISSLDPFYIIGNQLIETLDFEGRPIWIPTLNGAGSDATFNERQNANLNLVYPFNFAIGTASKLTKVIFSFISLQYFALIIGGLTLIILVFPLRLERPLPTQAYILIESEYSSNEEPTDVAAK